MTDREIIREGGDSVGSIVLGILIAVAIIIAVWAFITGRIHLPRANTPAPQPQQSGVQINVPIPTTNGSGGY